MKIRKIILVAGASLLAACAAGPDYVRPDTAVPENWGATAADTRILGPWWREFGDPELTAFVMESFAHNNDIRVAVANVDAAAATLRLARAEVPANRRCGSRERADTDQRQHAGTRAFRALYTAFSGHFP